jgi:hypothetical protein
MPKRGRKIVVGCAAALVLVLGAWAGYQTWAARKDTQGRPSPDGTAAPIAWPDDFPQQLRDRQPGRPIALIAPMPPPAKKKNDPARADLSVTPGQNLFQPAWCRRLRGDGLYYTWDDNVTLRGQAEGTKEGYTVLALDDDRRQRWFEFEVEMLRLKGASLENAAGIFFGWLDFKPHTARAYFIQVVRLPEKDTDEVLIGHAEVPTGERSNDMTERLVLTRIAPPIQVPVEGHILRLRVRALPGKVSIYANGERRLDFDPPFDPRGPLGIWVQDAKAMFGKATVTALADPEP